MSDLQRKVQAEAGALFDRLATKHLRAKLKAYEMSPHDLVKWAGSQRALANIVGVSQQSVCHWCKTGNMPHKHRHFLADFYGGI